MRVDFERFFAGALPVPPEALREQIAHQFRELRAANVTGVAENFRLGTLEAQFSAMAERYGRRLRETEEGRGAKRGRDDTAPPRYDPVAGIAVGAGLETGAVEALWRGLYQSSGRTVSADLDSFRAYLGQQMAAIRQKTGCSEVQFRVATEEGKLKLKAKPLSTAGAP